MNKIFSEFSPAYQLIFAVFITLVAFLLTLILGVFIAIPLFGVNVSSFASNFDVNNSENLVFIKYFQAVQSIGLFILPPFIIALLMSKPNEDYLSVKRSPKLLSVLLVFITVLISVPFINVVIGLNEAMSLPDFLSGLEQWMRQSEDEAKKITEAFLSVTTLEGLLSNLFVIAVLPALGEELLFRGVLQKLLSEITNNVHWGVIISALLFSALHLQFYGFLPRFILGLYLGYLLVWSKSLWLSVLAHFFNNAMAILFYFFFYKEATEINPDTIGTENYVVAGMSFLLVVFLLYYTRLGEIAAPKRFQNTKSINQ